MPFVVFLSLTNMLKWWWNKGKFLNSHYFTCPFPNTKLERGKREMNYNPYNNGYQPYQPYTPQKNTYAFVNGIEGARAYQMLPNQTVLLMDSDSPVCFMKQSDNMGKANLKCFKLVEIQEQELKGVITNGDGENTIRNEILGLNKRIDELYKLLSPRKEGKPNA